MIALLCLLFAGSFAAPYEQSVFDVRSLSTPILELGAGLESSYGQQRQLVRVASPVRVLQEQIPTIVRVQNEIPITKFDHLINPEAGQYSLDFQTGNGISTKESGFLKAVPVATRLLSSVDSYGYGGETRIEEVDAVAQVKSGETSWCSPEGIRFTLTYVADETGYHPQLTKGSCQISYDAAPLQTRTILSDSY